MDSLVRCRSRRQSRCFMRTSPIAISNGFGWSTLWPQAWSVSARWGKCQAKKSQLICLSGRGERVDGAIDEVKVEWQLG